MHPNFESHTILSSCLNNSFVSPAEATRMWELCGEYAETLYGAPLSKIPFGKGQREVKENYLPCSTEYIASQIGTSYSLEYYDHYILPFLANVVKRDFDITIKDYTHVKFIYKLKG